MRALALLWLALVAVVVPTSCSIDHPSDELACTTQADCDSTRTCTNGYCIVGGGTSTMCPAGCTTCDLTAKTCAIAGSGNAKITCPTGYSCTITCGNNACGEVDCQSATACVVQCTGTNSCDRVRCGSGRCTVSCGGTGSCTRVECPDACACDVTCNGASSCDNTTCPTGCDMGTGCTSQGGACGGC